MRWGQGRTGLDCSLRMTLGRRKGQPTREPARTRPALTPSPWWGPTPATRLMKTNEEPDGLMVQRWNGLDWAGGTEWREGGRKVEKVGLGGEGRVEEVGAVVRVGGVMVVVVVVVVVVTG